MSGSTSTNNTAVQFEQEQAAASRGQGNGAAGQSEEGPGSDRPDLQRLSGDGDHDQQLRLVEIQDGGERPDYRSDHRLGDDRHRRPGRLHRSPGSRQRQRRGKQ